MNKLQANFKNKKMIFCLKGTYILIVNENLSHFPYAICWDFLLHTTSLYAIYVCRMYIVDMYIRVTIVCMKKKFVWILRGAGRIIVTLGLKLQCWKFETNRTTFSRRALRSKVTHMQILLFIWNKFVKLINVLHYFAKICRFIYFNRK